MEKEEGKIMEKPVIATHTGGGGNEPQGRQGLAPNESILEPQATLTPCHPELTFSLAQRKSKQKESKTEGLSKQLCHPELRILCRERTESETRSSANKRECERSEMNDLFAWHTFSLAQRKSMQKESETGWLSKQLCHPESCLTTFSKIFDFEKNVRFPAGSSPRKIIPSAENVNNIPFASRAAQRHVKGGCATRKAAFTLAEVLITLGIIGVVAALTLPTLIQNYQKQVVITRLKYAYNVLSNVLKRAEADYGNITEWGLESSGDADYSTIDAVKLRENFVRQYMLPYISDAKFTTNNPLSYYGYKTEIKKAYGSMAYPLDTGAPMVLQFKNGMVIILNVGVATSPEDPDKLGVAGITFVIDVDGPSGKNIFGRDVYWEHIPFVTNTRFMFYRLYAIYANKVMSPIHVARASLIDECKNGGYYCAFLIHSDGWQIKDDYPHKF